MNLAEIFRDELKESMGRQFYIELSRCKTLEDFQALLHEYAVRYGGEKPDTKKP